MKKKKRGFEKEIVPWSIKSKKPINPRLKQNDNKRENQKAF